MITTTTSEPCPFRVGDRVVYRPSDRGYGLEAMNDERMEPGKTYVVREIAHEYYVLVEGDHHPGGGLYWTEFEAAP
jgi:hypothetical protein